MNDTNETTYKTILGLDIGTTGIGWSIGDKHGVIHVMRNKADSKKRSEARCVRRRYTGIRYRKRKLGKLFGIKIEKPEKGQPIGYEYFLRVKALREELSEEELARVLIHIARHRHNRKYMSQDEKKKESKSDKKSNDMIKSEDFWQKRVKELIEKKQKEKDFPELMKMGKENEVGLSILLVLEKLCNKKLSSLHDNREVMRMLENKLGKNTAEILRELSIFASQYDDPDSFKFEEVRYRENIDDELKAILSKQQNYHVLLGDKNKRDEICKCVVEQRNLRAKYPGLCSVYLDKGKNREVRRAPIWLFEYELFKLYQNLSNFRCEHEYKDTKEGDKPLTEKGRLTKYGRDKLVREIIFEKKYTKYKTYTGKELEKLLHTQSTLEYHVYINSEFRELRVGLGRDNDDAYIIRLDDIYKKVKEEQDKSFFDKECAKGEKECYCLECYEDTCTKKMHDKLNGQLASSRCIQDAVINVCKFRWKYLKAEEYIKLEFGGEKSSLKEWGEGKLGEIKKVFENRQFENLSIEETVVEIERRLRCFREKEGDFGLSDDVIKSFGDHARDKHESKKYTLGIIKKILKDWYGNAQLTKANEDDDGSDGDGKKSKKKEEGESIVCDLPFYERFIDDVCQGILGIERDPVKCDIYEHRKKWSDITKIIYEIRHLINDKEKEGEVDEKIKKLCGEYFNVTVDDDQKRELKRYIGINIRLKYGKYSVKALNFFWEQSKERVENVGELNKRLKELFRPDKDESSTKEERGLTEEELEYCEALEKNDTKGKYEQLPSYHEVLQRYIDEVDEETEIGSIPNPIAHTILNRLRELVNTLSKQGVLIKEIVIETSRDMSRSKKEKEKITKEQKSNAEYREKLNIVSFKHHRDMRKLLEDLHGGGFKITDNETVERVGCISEFELGHISPDALGSTGNWRNRFLISRGDNMKMGSKIQKTLIKNLIKEIKNLIKELKGRQEELRGEKEGKDKLNGTRVRLLNEQIRYLGKKLREGDEKDRLGDGQEIEPSMHYANKIVKEYLECLKLPVKEGKESRENKEIIEEDRDKKETVRYANAVIAALVRKIITAPDPDGVLKEEISEKKAGEFPEEEIKRILRYKDRGYLMHHFIDAIAIRFCTKGLYDLHIKAEKLYGCLFKAWEEEFAKKEENNGEKTGKIEFLRADFNSLARKLFTSGGKSKDDLEKIPKEKRCWHDYAERYVRELKSQIEEYIKETGEMIKESDVTEDKEICWDKVRQRFIEKLMTIKFEEIHCGRDKPFNDLEELRNYVVEQVRNTVNPKDNRLYLYNHSRKMEDCEKAKRKNIGAAELHEATFYKLWLVVSVGIEEIKNKKDKNGKNKREKKFIPEYKSGFNISHDMWLEILTGYAGEIDPKFTVQHVSHDEKQKESRVVTREIKDQIRNKFVEMTTKENKKIQKDLEKIYGMIKSKAEKDNGDTRLKSCVEKIEKDKEGGLVRSFKLMIVKRYTLEEIFDNGKKGLEATKNNGCLPILNCNCSMMDEECGDGWEKLLEIYKAYKKENEQKHKEEGSNNEKLAKKKILTGFIKECYKSLLSRKKGEVQGEGLLEKYFKSNEKFLKFMKRLNINDKTKEIQFFESAKVIPIRTREFLEKKDVNNSVLNFVCTGNNLCAEIDNGKLRVISDIDYYDSPREMSGSIKRLGVGDVLKIPGLHPNCEFFYVFKMSEGLVNVRPYFLANFVRFDDNDLSEKSKEKKRESYKAWYQPKKEKPKKEKDKSDDNDVGNGENSDSGGNNEKLRGEGGIGVGSGKLKDAQLVRLDILGNYTLEPLFTEEEKKAKKATPAKKTKEKATRNTKTKEQEYVD